MSIVKNGTKSTLRAVYKKEYDVSGDFWRLSSTTVTLSKVRETATYEQMYMFVHILMGWTEYREAPYKVQIVDTAELVVG